ncbi:glycosyltransferase [Aquabacterium sp. NJ1]|uniref:glycosyltransferase n=1 Tax=Aquabacterium sp. NJ1 TaxID=1538295 RepID=UPI0009DD1F3E|nr:glycosyltransferase [Aquabacterium sp. NJ1]
MRVIHFVTGGFSGATQVAVDLVRACGADPEWEAVLVLRRKSQTEMARVQQLRDEGLTVELVPGWAHVATIQGLIRVCEAFRPDVLVAHGFSEHLWGRYAGLLAKVPVLVHVEHNSRERYSAWRLAQARWLAKRTALIVGCSEGVRSSLLALGFDQQRTVAIPNGIRLAPFADAVQRPFAARVPGIVMSARFARQKDHATLIRAVALLKERGLAPPVSLAGGGKQRDRDAAERLASSLGLGDQVRFLGHCPTVPDLLMSHQIYVLATHFEGMPLALVEAMAAGCAVVGSAVVGVRELLRDGVDGRLVPEADPVALANVLEDLLRHPERAAQLAQSARERANVEFGVDVMARRYAEHIRSAWKQAQGGVVHR